MDSLRLNLGSGENELAGYINIDIKHGKLAYPLDYQDNIIDEIRASHLLEHYPYGKIFYCEDIKSESNKFHAKDRVPTGLLSGKKARYAAQDAFKFEEEFIVETQEQGSRRFAWVFPDEIESEYKEEKGWFELSFTLPKGSYATELIAELVH